MLQYERFEKIMDLLKQQSSVRVTELVPLLDASESTIRRDIAELDKAGRLRKVFGGAVSAGGTDNPVNAQSRDMGAKALTRTCEKMQVAVHAASLIEPGDLIYIDAGTTTGSMIDAITCYDAVYVTNGARHAIYLAQRGLKTYLLSGQVKASTEAIIGQDAVVSLQKYHFNKCFIGTDGIDKDNGYTTADIEESMVKTEAMSRSEKAFVLADSSKFGLVASITFAPLQAGTVITDQLPDSSYRTKTEIIEIK
ncbi:MAG: DeoR/GlpR family DNA-binding transcription regulator [Bacillota bacterium]|nr:DeoR/GlpR family DNA-binding transcription regulator [Bacillota bacterium]